MRRCASIKKENSCCHKKGYVYGNRDKDTDTQMHSDAFALHGYERVMK